MRAFEVLMLLCKVTFAIIAVMHLVVSTVLNIAFVVAKIKVGTTEKTVFGPRRIVKIKSYVETHTRRFILNTIIR